MANNFNMNPNKKCFNGEFSATTISGNFCNDAMTLNYGGVPDTSDTPTPITFTVTFNNADNNGGTETYTATAFETIGHAIEEQALSITNYAPTYYYNESIVADYTIIPIKSDIEIDVKWTDISED